MTKFDCECRIMGDIINLNSGNVKTQLGLLAQNLRECLREALQETNEIPVSGK